MIGTARATPARGFPLLEAREDVRTVAIVPLTGDRGLAGGFNAQIIRRALGVEREARGEGQDVRWLVAGKKGRSTLRFRRYEIEQAWIDFTDRPDYADAAAIARKLSELFIEREVDRVVLVYNHFVSPLTQTVEVEDVLPIPRHALEEDEEKSAYEIALEGDFIYEPEPEIILERLLPDLPRDDDLPRAPRVGRLGARRPNDRDAKREPERRRARRAPDARHEPSPPGRDHPGAARGRRRRRRARG